MRTGQVIALLTVVAIIALALGATIGYGISSGRTSTTTQTSTMTNSSGTLFSQSTTYTTVSRTTLSFYGSTYATTTGEYSGCIPPVQCYLTTVTTGINSSPRLYELVFIQMGACPEEYYIAPWSVTINNLTTVSEPSNATLPISDQSASWSNSFKNYSTIIFSVPSGSYNYTARPENFLANHSGNVTVTNRDMTVEIGSTIGCPTQSQNSTK